MPPAVHILCADKGSHALCQLRGRNVLSMRRKRTIRRGYKRLARAPGGDIVLILLVVYFLSQVLPARNSRFNPALCIVHSGLWLAPTRNGSISVCVALICWQEQLGVGSFRC
jgi:hypothetical protein